jgi:hypothetical protein
LILLALKTGLRLGEVVHPAMLMSTFSPDAWPSLYVRQVGSHDCPFGADGRRFQAEQPAAPSSQRASTGLEVGTGFLGGGGAGK